MKLQIQGEISHIGETQHIADNLSKREFILIVGKTTQYPQYLKFSMLNSRGDILSKFTKGDQVTVDFNLKGRMDPKNDTNAYNTLEAWKVVK